jgi:hypothetical protein
MTVKMKLLSKIRIVILEIHCADARQNKSERSLVYNAGNLNRQADNNSSVIITK